MQGVKRASVLLLCCSSLYIVFQAPSCVCLECPSETNASWKPYKNRCYAFLDEFSKHSLGIEDARELCRASASSADLVSVKSEEENMFLVNTYRTNWQGPEEVWLGMFYDTDTDTLKWFDNSNVSYSNWTKQHTEDLPLAEICAVMHIKYGHWSKVNCEVSSRTGIICEAAFSKFGDKKALISVLVIMCVTFVSISTTVLWFLCERKRTSVESASPECHSTAQTPHGDNCILLESEELEHAAEGV
ncbi:CD302 antigen [Protopterus annectens]|uniref:CD302 antigen n=1 Tax=Protopterus annectens TaxID=7888 RepID=UPI001CF952C3|nr:CD302 antigen [Protopterus annectens]